MIKLFKLQIFSQPIAEAPKEVSSNSEVTETVTATEEVTPSTGTSVPEEQTAENK